MKIYMLIIILIILISPDVAKSEDYDTSNHTADSIERSIHILNGDMLKASSMGKSCIFDMEQKLNLDICSDFVKFVGSNIVPKFRFMEKYNTTITTVLGITGARRFNYYMVNIKIALIKYGKHNDTKKTD